jgi:hypothetical protein
VALPATRIIANGIDRPANRRFLETGQFCLTSECVKSHGGRNASQARIASCAPIYERKGDVSQCFYELPDLNHFLRPAAVSVIAIPLAFRRAAACTARA